MGQLFQEACQNMYQGTSLDDLVCVAIRRMCTTKQREVVKVENQGDQRSLHVQAIQNLNPIDIYLSVDTYLYSCTPFNETF